jgi:hypothetical protein
VYVRPIPAARSFSRSFGVPGTHRPARSPFTSARKTGTPARASPSARSWSVRVLPVPVEPAIRPCRFIMRRGMRIGSVPCGLPSCSAWPTSIPGAAKEHEVIVWNRTREKAERKESSNVVISVGV